MTSDNPASPPPNRSGPPTRLLVCNCQATMEIDGDRLARALGHDAPLTVFRELCRSQVPAYEAALKSSEPLLVACTQEAPLFREIAADVGDNAPALAFTNIRERAGWCAGKVEVTAKMAALLADAVYKAKPTGLMTLKSDGVCLVYGPGQVALDAAKALAGRLSVSVVLSEVGDVLPPAIADVTIAKGRIRRLSGHIGAFDVEVDDYAAVLPSSRGTLSFAMARNGAKSRCDLVFDLSGGRTLINDHRRDGYLRADPRDPAAVAKSLFEIADLVGEFEKPLYVSYDASICAHSRSGKVGCSNCLDVCPTGAITPDGDHVRISDAICGGCGNCSAVCPTGAVRYAFPEPADVIGRADGLIDTYLKAGGRRPILLVHDERHGMPLIDAMARLGRGLPPHVLPLSLPSALQIGHDLVVAMLAAGAEQIVVLAPPEHPEELAALEAQSALATALLDGLGFDGPRVSILCEADPDAVETALHGLPHLKAIARRAVSARGSKRDRARSALARLHEIAPQARDHVGLPSGSPYGRIGVDIAGCTLCLSCVGACPTGAITDNPERPQISFTEAACVQCGICVATCPESVISLEPRYDFTSAALSPTVLKAEEPFDCVRCGKPFGAKSSISRVVERLKGHSMFQSESQIRLIQMCEDCRVVTLAEQKDDPFRSADRPRVRTTEDYIAAAAKKGDRDPEDFLS